MVVSSTLKRIAYGWKNVWLKVENYKEEEGRKFP